MTHDSTSPSIQTAQEVPSMANWNTHTHSQIMIRIIISSPFEAGKLKDDKHDSLSPVDDA